MKLITRRKSYDFNQAKIGSKRWLVVAAVMLMNLSIAMVWLTFSPVAYKTSVYYGISLQAVNALSLIFVAMAIPFGIIVTLLLEKYGLRFCLLTGATLSVVGTTIRVFSAFDINANIAFLFIGQSITAIASPFGTYVSAKVAGLWFPEDERTLANTLVSIANPIGIILTGIISPLFVADDNINMLLMLIVYDILPVIAFGMMLAVMTTDGPKVPPSLGSERTMSEDIWEGIKVVCLHNSMFMILVICLGGGIGLYTAYATLLQQILCPWGYTDTLAGYSASTLTLVGVIGAGFIGVFVDKTKLFSETLKVAFIMTAVGITTFAFTHDIYMGYAILAEVAVIGLFAFCIFPIGTEVAAECTYPVGIATGTGIILFSGQIQSLIIILVMQGIRTPMSEEDVILNDSKCYYSDEDAYTSGEDPSEEITYDMRVSMYFAAGYAWVIGLVIAIFFKPEFRRRMAEERAKRRGSTYGSSYL